MLGDSDRYEAEVRALFARRPAAMVRGLGRIRAVCERLGAPQERFEAVHITGTNGKTTLARLISAVLTCSGLKVGTFTSPHLQDVRERVHIDGRPISPSAFLAHLEKLAPALKDVERDRDEMVTFFETMTALAFHYFASRDVDVAVVEVGMGGQRDATNVARARVAVLGPIGLDHPQLGSCVEAVTREKAGIVKDGVRAVVSARQPPAVAAIIAGRARRTGARLAVEGRDFAVAGRRPLPGGQEVDLAGLGVHLRGVRLGLYGAHQAANAAAALAASESFLTTGGGTLAPDAARRGFAAARSAGRLELVPRTGAAPVLLDGAHNPDGARALARALRTDFPDFDRRVLVLGMLGDKDMEAVVRALIPAVHAIVVTQPPGHRATPAAKLALVVSLAGGVVLAAADVREALTRASDLARPACDVVVVTGSLYTVGAARDVLRLAPST